MRRQTIRFLINVGLTLLTLLACAACNVAPAPEEDTFLRVLVDPKISFVELEKTLRSHDVTALEGFDVSGKGVEFVAHLPQGEVQPLTNVLEHDKKVHKCYVVSGASLASDVGSHVELRDEQFYRWVLCKMKFGVDLKEVQAFMDAEMKGVGQDESPTAVEMQDADGTKRVVKTNPRARLINVRPGHLMEAFFKLKSSGLFFSVMQNRPMPGASTQTSTATGSGGKP